MPCSAGVGACGCPVGFVHGLSLYLFLLPWIGEFVGNLPYVALAVTEALYSIAVGAGGAVLMKRRMHWAFPLWFVSVEWLRSTWPFGGFAWGRIAWGQVGGPLQYLAPYGGPALVSVATLACATGLALCLLRPRLLGAVLLVVPLALGGGGVDKQRQWGSRAGNSGGNSRECAAAGAGF